MLGKNNLNGKFQLAANKQCRFSIRKLSVGAASVVLGMLLWNAVPGTTVQADTTSEQVFSESANQAVTGQKDETSQAKTGQSTAATDSNSNVGGG